MIYTCFPSSRIWHKLFDSMDLVGGRSGTTETRVLQEKVVIGSLVAMWTMLAFASLPASIPGDLDGHSFTRSEGFMLCLSLIHRLPDEGPAGARNHSTSKQWVIIDTCPWCNGYCHRIWTRRYEFNSWIRLIAFHIALIPLGKVWIQLFSLQLWVNIRTD